MNTLKVIWVPIEKVKPFHRNAKAHSQEQINKLAASISEFGFNKPIVVDKDYVIVAGHGTLEAARLLKRPKIPIFVASHLTRTQVAAYRLADNRIAEDSSWDRELLGVELKDLDRQKYDLGKTGFEEDELAEILGKIEPDDGAATDEDSFAPEPHSIPVTRTGDLWTLGNHRLLCADSLEPKSLARVTQGISRIHMVYTDPPYGVKIVQETGMTTSISDKLGPALIKGSTRGHHGMGGGFGDIASRGKIGGDKPFGKVGGIHRGMKARPIIAANSYDEIAGDESPATAIAAYNLVAKIKPRPVLIFWGGNYYANALPPSSCWIVWDKNNGESFFADAELAWTNQKTAVRIFQHTWNGQSPIALAEWCYENYGKEGDVVLDLFGGSGSALLAGEKMKRVVLVVEKAPAYCDTIIRRWQEKTSGDAMLRAENLTWTEAKKKRRPRRR